MFRLIGGAVILALLGGLVGCGRGEDRPGVGNTVSGSVSGVEQRPAFSKQQATTVVRVVEREFSIDPIPKVAKGPKVYFEVVNEGALRHELVVVNPSGKDLMEVHVGKGETKPLTVKLKPGVYRLECRIKEGDKTHLDYGMVSTFTVQ